MAIGNFGKLITFETSDKRVLTFNGFSRTVSGKWTNHERIGLKSKSEFMGPELQTISFDITLNAIHGVKPSKVLKKLENAIETGQVESLVIGGKRIGKKWKITEMSDSWDVILNRGELVLATVKLTLEEYY